MSKKSILDYMVKKIFDWSDLEDGLTLELVDLDNCTAEEKFDYINSMLEDYWFFKNKNLTKLEKKYAEILSSLVKQYGH